MKFFSAIVILFSSLSVWACSTDQIVMARSYGFGLNLSNQGMQFNGGIRSHVSIPFTYAGKDGCFTQEAGLDFNVIKNENEKIVGFEIYPPKVKFKRVRGSVKAYLMLDDSEIKKQLDIVAFTCVGESVAAIESYSGGVENLALVHDMNQVTAQMSSVFAIGAAAQILRQREIEAHQYKTQLGYDTIVTDNFLEIFHEKSQGIASDWEAHLLKIPTVHMKMNTQVGQMNMAHSLNSVNVSQYGCSEEFSELMQEYELKKSLRKLKDSGYEIKENKKTKSFQINWKL